MRYANEVETADSVQVVLRGLGERGESLQSVNVTLTKEAEHEYASDKPILVFEPGETLPSEVRAYFEENYYLIDPNAVEIEVEAFGVKKQRGVLRIFLLSRKREAGKTAWQNLTDEPKVVEFNDDVQLWTVMRWTPQNQPRTETDWYCGFKDTEGRPVYGQIDDEGHKLIEWDTAELGTATFAWSLVKPVLFDMTTRKGLGKSERRRQSYPS